MESIFKFKKLEGKISDVLQELLSYKEHMLYHLGLSDEKHINT
jgi:hypothetical protein